MTSAINLLKRYDLDEISYFKASGSYAEAYFKDNSKYLLSYNLRRTENQLRSDQFFRVHRSYLVNLKYISHVYHKQGKLLLLNGEEIPLARLRKRQFLKAWGKQKIFDSIKK